MHRFSYFQGVSINAAIFSIDIALWDIKGKALGVPIYELLGGACRTKAPVYGHIYESTIEKVLEECERKKDLLTVIFCEKQVWGDGMAGNGFQSSRCNYN
jgi:galactonate dehydratase